MQTTFEAVAAMAKAKRLLYQSHSWVKEGNPRAQHVDVFRRPGRHRLGSYEDVCEAVLQCLRQGEDVVYVHDGHPIVGCYSGRTVVRRARLEGYAVEVLAGVSSLDNLFAELGFDPTA